MIHDSTISVMKGIAIIGVVVGHCRISQWAENFVNQWHLATFFFVAGMCFKDKYTSQPQLYIKRRMRSLYVPFVEFGLLYLALHNFLYWIHCAGNAYTFREMGRELFNLTIRFSSNEALMGAMWFCPALLFTSIIMFLTQITQTKIDKTLNNNKIEVNGGGGGLFRHWFLLSVIRPYSYALKVLVVYGNIWFSRS